MGRDCYVVSYYDGMIGNTYFSKNKALLDVLLGYFIGMKVRYELEDLKQIFKEDVVSVDKIIEVLDFTMANVTSVEVKNILTNLFIDWRIEGHAEVYESYLNEEEI